MATGDIVVGLDIGTTKICTIVGELNNSGEINVIGYGIQNSSGLKKGLIIDLEKTIKEIEDSIIYSEDMADVDIDSVYVGIGGSNIESFNSKGVIAITGNNREINEDDRERVIEAARAVNIPSNREIIHVIPVDYTVDEQSEIREPLGMIGTKLEVNTHIVTNTTTVLKNLVKGVKGSGLSIKSIILQSLASAESVLTKDDKDLGVVVADIGGGTTDIAIFKDGNIQYTSVLPIGSDNITNDIAVCQIIPHSEAESIKLEYGTLNSSIINANEEIEVQCTDHDTKKMVSRFELHEIISSRTEEIIEMIEKETVNSGIGNSLPSGIVLTGGGAQMDGLVEFAKNILDKPVRVGRPLNVNFLNEKTASPKFATAIGLMIYGLKLERMKNSGIKNRDSLVKQIIHWFKDWFKDLF